MRLKTAQPLLWIFLSLPWIPLCVSAQVNLNYANNETVTWQEAIDMYGWLDRQYEEGRLIEAGLTDAGRPLHLFIISGDSKFRPEEIRRSGRNILFINNGIHPGEPCGVDASLELARGLLSGSDGYSDYLDQTVVVIVPILNVGGALNRSPFNRANQNGPEEQGFRGNARNLDLNRDFIKMDSRNVRSLATVLREWDPEIFIDTHTSNGADYPYTITLIHSHLQRHEPSQSGFLDQTMLPFLYEAMEETPYPMCPYVWSYGRSPETGIVGFMDYPRYTSGYASLFNTLAFTVETHMFKPFEDRMRSTWHFLREMLRFSSLHREEIARVREKAWEERLSKTEFVLEWEQDTTRFDLIPFRGYAAKTKTGPVTGHPQLYYDRNETWEKEIPFYRYFSPAVTVKAPRCYYLPSAWKEAVERFRLIGVEMKEIPRDTVTEADVYYIVEYQTRNEPYNGHYWHYGTKVRSVRQQVQLLAGDLVIPVRQQSIEYIVQTLEPQGYDSFFSWNFFDEVLSRKEYFSPYIFEDMAVKILENDPVLNEEFEARKSDDPSFAANPYLQLKYIYERSPWSEKSYMRYPVFRSVD